MNKLYVLSILLGMTCPVVADVLLTFDNEGKVQEITCEQTYTTDKSEIKYGYNCNQISNGIIGNVPFNMCYTDNGIFETYLNEFERY